MKFVLSLVVVLVVVSGVWQWGGNSITEAHVREIYKKADAAISTADDKAMCALLAEDYQQSVVMKSEFDQSEQVIGKQEYCAELARTMDVMRQIKTRIGRLPMRHTQTIKNIVIAEDGGSAKVEVSSVLEMPGMRMVSRGHDTITRHRWQTLVARSVAVAHVGGND